MDRAQHRVQVEVAVGGVQQHNAIGLELARYIFTASAVSMCTGIASDVKASMMNRSKLSSCSFAIVRRASPTTMSMIGLALRNEREVLRVLGDLDHGRIDLEEPPRLAFPLVAGAGAGAQTDDAVAALLALCREHLAPLGDGLTHRAARIVVGGRRRIIHRLAVVVEETLGAVQRRAVDQDVIQRHRPTDARDRRRRSSSATRRGWPRRAARPGRRR